MSTCSLYALPSGTTSPHFDTAASLISNSRAMADCVLKWVSASDVRMSPILTALKDENQPQSTEPRLTSVAMRKDPRSLAERLAAAANGKVTQKEIAEAAKVTEAAISKLFKGKSLEIKAAHAFPIARLCKVDPEWLATGYGPAPDTKTDVREKKPTTPLEEFEPKHIDLLRMYKRLPKDLRHHIRSMIQTLAAAQREDYHSWIAEQRKAMATEPA